MDFRPLHDRVVVKRIEGEEKAKGGIIIPDTAKESLRAGDSGKLTPLDVKAGDRALFGKWSGEEVNVDGQDLLIMKDTRAMATGTSGSHKVDKALAAASKATGAFRSHDAKK